MGAFSRSGAGPSAAARPPWRPLLRAFSLALAAIWFIAWGIYGAIGNWAGWLLSAALMLWALTLLGGRSDAPSNRH